MIGDHSWIRGKNCARGTHALLSRRSRQCFDNGAVPRLGLGLRLLQQVLVGIRPRLYVGASLRLSIRVQGVAGLVKGENRIVDVSSCHPARPADARAALRRPPELRSTLREAGRGGTGLRLTEVAPVHRLVAEILDGVACALIARAWDFPRFAVE